MTRAANAEVEMPVGETTGTSPGHDPFDAASFDYGVAAELFPTRSRKTRRSAMKYRRFARAADAIRFAVEELPSELLPGAYLEVDEKRFSSHGIRRLYDSARYPLARRKR
jgi:hypothetical protein